LARQRRTIVDDLSDESRLKIIVIPASVLLVDEVACRVWKSLSLIAVEAESVSKQIEENEFSQHGVEIIVIPVSFRDWSNCLPCVPIGYIGCIRNLFSLFLEAMCISSF
jgi:hypothetical protein